MPVFVAWMKLCSFLIGFLFFKANFQSFTIEKVLGKFLRETIRGNPESFISFGASFLPSTANYFQHIKTNH